MKYFNDFRQVLFALLLCFSSASTAYSKPWLETGDMLLRHQLQLLSDNDLISAPLTSWPLSSKDIYLNLNANEKQFDSQEFLSIVTDINSRLKQEDYGSSYKIEANATSKALLVRDFSANGKERSSISYDGQLGSSILDIRLKGTVSEKTKHPDDSNIRLDESYVSTSVGNWRFSVGSQSRWWGPGWDGSLILSNNARPLPSLSLDREESTPFQSKFLRWIGPWKLSMFAGQLEPTRKIPDAKVLGARFNFKPTPNFEVGLSRIAQWGGEGRVQSFSTLLNSIIGKDNSGGAQEPGNQLAGFDFRWKSPISNKPYAVYGQMIGEDEAGYLPYQYISLLGVEMWGNSKKLDGSWRLYIEASDTSADSLQGRERNNVAYNHHLYQDGYRYLDTSLGHGIDSDSQIIGIGGLLAQNNGNFWRAWAKHAKLNVDGIGLNTIAPNGRTWTGVGLSLDKNLNKQIKVNMGIQYISEKEATGETNNDVGLSIGFVKSF